MRSSFSALGVAVRHYTLRGLVPLQFGVLNILSLDGRGDKAGRGRRDACAPGMGDALNCLHPGSLPMGGGVMKAGALLAPSSMFALSLAGSFLLALWRVLAAFAPASPLPWPFPLGGGDAGWGVRPHPGPFPREGEGTWRVLGPAPYLLLVPPLSREMSLPCKAVTPVLASRMPTSIARRHWGCSPSSNFPGRLTGPCGTACVSRLDLPPAKASGCAGYGPPGRPRVRTWNGGDAFGTTSSWRGAEHRGTFSYTRGPRPTAAACMNTLKIW